MSDFDDYFRELMEQEYERLQKEWDRKLTRPMDSWRKSLDDFWKGVVTEMNDKEAIDRLTEIGLELSKDTKPLTAMALVKEALEILGLEKLNEFLTVPGLSPDTTILFTRISVWKEVPCGG